MSVYILEMYLGEVGVVCGVTHSPLMCNCVYRRVYQCLKGLGRLVEPSELGNAIVFGELSRFKNIRGLFAVRLPCCMG